MIGSQKCRERKSVSSFIYIYFIKQGLEETILNCLLVVMLLCSSATLQLPPPAVVVLHHPLVLRSKRHLGRGRRITKVNKPAISQHITLQHSVVWWWWWWWWWWWHDDDVMMAWWCSTVWCDDDDDDMMMQHSVVWWWWRWWCPPYDRVRVDEDDPGRVYGCGVCCECVCVCCLAVIVQHSVAPLTLFNVVSLVELRVFLVQLQCNNAIKRFAKRRLIKAYINLYIPLRGHLHSLVAFQSHRLENLLPFPLKMLDQSGKIPHLEINSIPRNTAFVKIVFHSSIAAFALGVNPTSKTTFLPLTSWGKVTFSPVF